MKFIELTQDGKKFLVNTGHIVGISRTKDGKGAALILKSEFATPRVDETYEEISEMLNAAGLKL